MTNQRNNFAVALTKQACPICAKSVDGDIVINTLLTEHMASKVRELHGQVTGISDKPCAECEGYMKLGIICVTIDETKSDEPGNPWRTGGFFVLTDAYIRRLMNDNPDLLQATLKKRAFFIEDKMARQLGLFDIKPTQGQPQ